MEHFVAKNVFDVAVVFTEDVDHAIAGVVYPVEWRETESESHPPAGHACVPLEQTWRQLIYSYLLERKYSGNRHISSRRSHWLSQCKIRGKRVFLPYRMLGV
jgi:hypothetical protein